MSKWLERLEKIKNTPNSHSQSPQKPPFEPFEGADSGIIQKKVAYPSIWDVTIQTDGKLQSMVVIDPSHEEEAAFKRELVERFGEQCLVTMKRRI